jgi:hypothetical protein
LSSLLLGAAVGAAVAGFVGVNLFAAIVDGGPALLNDKLGVLLTGLVAGLGSSPTHELVKSLQANKKARQLEVVGSDDVGRDGFSGRLAVRRSAGFRSSGIAAVVIRATD